MLGQHFRLYDQANPRAGLAQLFKTDTELVNEVCTALCSTCFFVIRRRRSAAANQLTADMPTHSCVRQRINYLAHSCAKLNQSFDKFTRGHDRSPSICNFHFSIFNLQFPFFNASPPSSYRRFPSLLSRARRVRPPIPSHVSVSWQPSRPRPADTRPTTRHAPASTTLHPALRGERLRPYAASQSSRCRWLCPGLAC